MTIPTYATLASAFPTATGVQINRTLERVALLNSTTYGSAHTAAALAQAKLLLSRDELGQAPGYWLGYERELAGLARARNIPGDDLASLSVTVTAVQGDVATTSANVENLQINQMADEATLADHETRILALEAP